MPKWEICRIKYDRRDGRRDERFMSIHERREQLYHTNMWKAVVVLDTPDGEKIIDQTDWYEGRLGNGYNKHSQLVGKLLAEGGEPFAVNPEGRVCTF